jgi:hypothetical protein
MHVCLQKLTTATINKLLHHKKKEKKKITRSTCHLLQEEKRAPVSVGGKHPYVEYSWNHSLVNTQVELRSSGEMGKQQ